MSLTDITNRQPITLTLNHTVGEALQIALQHRLENLPVLDEQARLAGCFGLHELLGLLLPKAATLEQGLTDLSFIANASTSEHLRTQLQQMASQPVGKHMSTAVSLDASTSLLEALLQLYRHGNEIPVVTKDGQFIGVISPWEILATLSGPEKR